MNRRQRSIKTSGEIIDMGINDKDSRPPISKLKCKVSVEDDLNQLFGDISIRTSKKSLDGTSPLRGNPSKKPITIGTPRTSGFGNAEALSLKQALRELCISKASEAASRRLSRSSASPRFSESGKMKNILNAVAVKAGPSNGGITTCTLEESVVPEKGKSNVSEKMPECLQIPKYKLSSQSCNSSPKFHIARPHDGASSSLVKKETYFSRREVTSQTSEQDRVPKMKRILSPSVSFSRRNLPLDEVRQGAVKVSLSPEERIIVSMSPEDRIIIPSEEMTYPIQALELKSLNCSAQTTTCFDVGMEQASSTSSVVHNNFSSAVKKVKRIHDAHYSDPSIGVPTIKNDTVYASENVWSDRTGHSSSKLNVATKQNSSADFTVKNESVSAQTLIGIHITNTDQPKIGKHSSGSTISCSAYGGNIAGIGDNDATLTRMPEKASQQILQQEGSFQPTAYKSGISNKFSKLPRSSRCSSKPVMRNRIVIKKKVKWHSTTKSVFGKYDQSNRTVDHTSQLVCQRCHCVLTNVNKESNQGSQVSLFSGSNAEVSSPSIKPELSKLHLNSKSYNTVVEREDFKTKGKGEFSQSSGSRGEYCSTSTSMDYDSNASSSTRLKKPHMSKDVRWAAIRNAIMQQGFLDLGHFNLLKKLGCGDIGTVYLGELIGSTCFFAIKVMDNEFLARRKKMLRAQIERQILGMLDHPFLPTLYAQFTSNNLSCLVMEFCPGGDLHVLRQKQSSQRFSETSARFYVAEVLLALEYLHMLGIVYRDLKPENVLVREDGHIMLTDFDLSLICDVSPALLRSSSADMDPARMSGPCASSGCIGPFCSDHSCQISCFSPRFLPATAKSKKSKADLAGKVGALPQLVAEPTEARSNSFVGTHEYLAPEIIRGEGHGAAVDWWTFGVFLYELLYGKTPFKGSGHEDTLANVVLRSLKFPTIPFVSSQARDLIRGLLAKDPEHRLGSVKGAAEIKQHSFFRGINWALIRCAVPPELSVL